MRAEGSGPAIRSGLWLLLAGALQALSFAPGPLPQWSLPFAQIIALSLLAFQTWQAGSPRQAGLRGWIFGLSQFTVGVYWLTISMHTFGGLPMPLAVAALLLFAAAMALYGAAACALTAWLCARHPGPHLTLSHQFLNAFIWASAWTLAEWLRGTLFTGFTWLNIGYAHAEGMLAGWAPVVGVYGQAWLAAFAAAAIALMARARDTRHDRSAAAVVGMALVLGLLGLLGLHVQWTQPSGQALVVRLVQPATSIDTKFDPEHFAQARAHTLQLAALPPKEGAHAPQLVVLPETVIPLFQDRVPPQVWAEFRETAVDLNAAILLGVPLHARTATGDRHTNGAAVLRPGEGTRAGPPRGWHYDKHHLVPFGEFIPPGFRWFVNAMNIPLGDFDRGPLHQPPLRLGDQSLAVDICYEDTFGEEIAASIAAGSTPTAGASILVNLSNLAWFGNTWALRQHLRMARIRALETGRPIIRATNTGMTAVIGPDGQVRGALDPDRPGVLDAEVPGHQGLTPYVRWRNGPVLIWVLATLAVAMLRRRTTRNATVEDSTAST